MLVEGLVASPRRLGLVDLDLDALCDSSRATRRSEFAKVPSRFPSAVIDLAVVTPGRCTPKISLSNCAARRSSSRRSSSSTCTAGATLPEGTRSLAYRRSLQLRRGHAQ